MTVPSAGTGHIEARDDNVADVGGALDVFSESSAQEPTLARFVISGEPFDIPWSLLAGKFRDSSLYGAASFALTNRKYDETDKHNHGVVLVTLARDIRSFRVIHKFVECGIPIIPPDPVDRQLLIAEASFFGLTGLANILSAGRTLAPPPRPPAEEVRVVVQTRTEFIKGKKRGAEKTEAEEAETVVRDGYVIPSASVIASYGMDDDDDTATTEAAAAPKKPWSFLTKSPAGAPSDLVERDREIRELENVARRRFGEGEDGTDSVPVIVVFGKDCPDLKPVVGPGYQFLSYPGLGAPIQEANPMAESLPEFERNFDALTLGMGAKLIEGLPLVAAGGAVLSALHRWDPEKIQGTASERYATTLRQFSSQGAQDQLLRRAFIAECLKKGITYDYSSRWWGGRRRRRRRFSVDDDQDELEKKVALLTKRFGGESPGVQTLGPEAEEALGLLAAITGIKWDKKGQLRPSTYVERENTRTDDPEDEDDRADRDANAAMDAFLTDLDETSETQTAGAGSPTDEERPDNVSLGPTMRPISAETAECVETPDAADDDTKDADDTKGAGTTAAVNAGELTYEPADQARRRAHSDDEDSDSDNEGDGPSTTPTDAETAKRRHKERCEKQRARTQRSFRGTDIDLFLTTRDADRALRTLFLLYKRIRRMVPGSHRIEFLRTEQSVSFILPWPYRKIQVITRLYHSVEQILLGFDIDCCSFAYDGKKVVSIPRAVRAVQTRCNTVDPSRQSITYESRLFKYAKRGFKIAIPGAEVEPHIRAITQKIDDAQNMRLYLSLSGLQLLLGMLYAAESRDRDLTRMLNVHLSDYSAPEKSLRGRVMRASRYGRKLPFVYGSDEPSGNGFEAVLLKGGKVVFNHSYRGLLIVPSTISPIVCFQKSAPHQQDRVDEPLLWNGAFHPCDAPWFAMG